jgi:hypothetical protein
MVAYGGAGSFFNSTPAAVRAGWLSILACIEVPCAVAGYWWATIHFHTQMHLWISICVAPLLLLRSNESVTVGKQWFTHYTEEYRIDSLDDMGISPGLLLNFAGSIVISAAITNFLVESWLAQFVGWPLLWRSMIAGWLAANVGIAISASTGAGGLSQTIDVLNRRGGAKSHGRIIEVSLAILWLIFELIAPALVAAVTATIVVANTIGLIAALGVLAGTATIILVLQASQFGKHPALWILLPIWGFGVGVGYLVRALIIRFTATALNLRPGWQAFPRNWRRTLFSTDFLFPPELIPGYSGQSRFNFTFLYKRLRSKPRWDEPDVFSLFLAIIYFAPAYAYRLSIKSTFWIYWPLAYISADLPRKNIRPAVFLDKLSATPLAWLSACLAASTLLGFVVTNFLTHVVTLWPALQIAFQIVAIEFILQLDWESQKPWVWFSLTSAAIALILFMWAAQMRPEFKHGDVDEDSALRIETNVGRMVRLARIGRVCTILLTLSLALYFLLWRSPLQCLLGHYQLDYVGTLFRWYFGKYMPEGPACL